MKIAHIGLSGPFTENMTYQDNLLSHQNALDGHQVLYISSATKFENGEIIDVSYEDKLLPDGVRLVRLPYQQWGNHFISNKLRKVNGLYKLLETFNPDVILSHNLGYWSVLDVICYKKNHPEVKLYADTHTAEYNSGTNWLSLHVLHRIFYRSLVQKAIPYLEKYFYIGESEKQFSLKHYGVPESLMEFFPLGGMILADEVYADKRARRRTELGVEEDEILLVHSGKFEAEKRTDELLQAFASVPDLKAKLAIIGSVPEDREALLSGLIEKDNRVQYLGWKTGAELQEYLCACDLYCQPGGVSATLQNAICCKSAILSYPHDIYTKDLDYGNILWVKTSADMIQAFLALKAGTIDLAGMKAASARCARELLDYRALAAKLYR